MNNVAKRGRPRGSKPASRQQADWSRSYEQRLIDRGARRMPGGMMPAEAVQCLDVLMRAGYAPSRVQVIARALAEAVAYYPRQKKHRVA